MTAERPLRSDVEGQVARAREIAGALARRRPRCDRDALHGAALLGLTQALQRSAGMNEAQFNSYSYKRIVGSVRDELRKQDIVSRGIRRKRAITDPYILQQASGGFVSCDLASVEVEIASARDETPEDLVARAEAWRRIEAALPKMEPRLAYVVRRSYQDGALCKDIGVELGLTESRVCQLQHQAVSWLRCNLKEEEEAMGERGKRGRVRIMSSIGDQVDRAKPLEPPASPREIQRDELLRRRITWTDKLGPFVRGSIAANIKRFCWFCFESERELLVSGTTGVEFCSECAAALIELVSSKRKSSRESSSERRSA